MTKTIPDRNIKCIVIPISDKDTFPVFYIVQCLFLSALLSKISVTWHISFTERNTFRKFARWIYLSHHDIRTGFSNRFATQIHLKQCFTSGWKFHIIRRTSKRNKANPIRNLQYLSEQCRLIIWQIIMLPVITFSFCHICEASEEKNRNPFANRLLHCTQCLLLQPLISVKRITFITFYIPNLFIIFFKLFLHRFYHLCMDVAASTSLISGIFCQIADN